MSGRYKLKNKGIRLEKVNDNNFVNLMKLEVAESQKGYVASNTVSMAQAYAVNAADLFSVSVSTMETQRSDLP